MLQMQLSHDPKIAFVKLATGKTQWVANGQDKTKNSLRTANSKGLTDDTCVAGEGERERERENRQQWGRERHPKRKGGGRRLQNC